MDECRLVTFNMPLKTKYLLPWFGHILESNDALTLLKTLKIIWPAFQLVTEDPILNLSLCICF